MSRFTKHMLMLLLTSVAAVGQDTMHARDYYAELVKTHSLSGFENEYSCFSDDPVSDHFFIFSTSETLHRLAQLKQIKGDFIIRLDYFKGLPGVARFMDKDNSESYSVAVENRYAHFKLTLSVNLKTGRYKDDLTSYDTAYGRCEETNVVEERIMKQ